MAFYIIFFQIRSFEELIFTKPSCFYISWSHFLKMFIDMKRMIFCSLQHFLRKLLLFCYIFSLTCGNIELSISAAFVRTKRFFFLTAYGCVMQKSRLLWSVHFFYLTCVGMHGKMCTGNIRHAWLLIFHSFQWPWKPSLLSMNSNRIVLFILFFMHLLRECWLEIEMWWEYPWMTQYEYCI